MDLVAIIVASLMSGLVLGALLQYITGTRPAQERYDILVERLYRMKRQGFVPQFTFEQAKELDPSEDIREY